MISRWIFICLALSAVSSVWAQARKPLTLEDIFSSDRFQGKTVANIRWSPDGSSFTFTKTEFRDDIGEPVGKIYRHDVESGIETLFLDISSLEFQGEPVKMSDYRIALDQKQVLITGTRKKIWRHSFWASHYIYDIEKGRLTDLADNAQNLQNVSFSPDGRHIAYAQDNNLFVADVTRGLARVVTSDVSGDILNGVFDWVYEEEFGRADAYRWSPDSKKIAYWRTDQSRVKTFVLLDELSAYSVPIRFKYPKVGEQNAIVNIGVMDVENGNTVWMDIGDNDDSYIPRIDWADSSQTLAIQRLNRKQNRKQLLLADVSTGETRVVVTDTDTAWVDVTDDFIFLEKTRQFVWTSERSGFRHIYVSDFAGGETEPITGGDWEVSSVIGVDDDGGWVYFYAKKDSPIEQHIYRTKLTGKKLQKITRKPGWHSGKFSKDFQHFVHFYSNSKTPTQILLTRSNGKLIRILEENKIAAFDEYDMVYPEFLSFQTEDGVTLNGLMLKPADFDRRKKYPVIVYGYGGPGSQVVVNRWSGKRHLWHQLMTQKGYLVFSIDNRGTGARGKAFKNLAYGDISKWAVEDHIEGAKYLATLPYVDASRIGFWGWSGGGYLACMLLTRGADYFRTGVAVAPVTDFRNYDTIWTERYMGLLSENEEGYQAANVNNYADRLKGNLLIIHGTGDDNVHPLNTMQFVDALVKENRQFDLMLYPNRNHGISGGNTRLHLYTLITDYFLENL